MKTRLLLLALAAALLGVGSLGAACKSGGEPMTMEEYFKELQALNDEAEQRNDDIGAALDDRLSEDASEEERVAALRESFDDIALVFDDFVSGLREIEPPAELQAAHHEAVAADEEAVRAFSDLTESIDAGTTLAEVDALFTEFESGTTGQRFTDACFALQSEADQRQIDVDLECEDEEG